VPPISVEDPLNSNSKVVKKRKSSFLMLNTTSPVRASHDLQQECCFGPEEPIEQMYL